MLKNIVVGANGKTFNFSFENVEFKDLALISLVEFIEAFDELGKQMSTGEAESSIFYFREKNLGLIKVRKNIISNEEIDLKIIFIENLPVDRESNEIFIINNKK